MTKSEIFHSATIPDSRLLRGLLGLRGLAALAILLFHMHHITGINIPQEFLFIERDFGYGAQLFFVLSAFSLMHSTEHTMNRPNWTEEYLIKRFFRIAPLFYMILILMFVAKVFMNSTNYPNLYSIFLNVFFVFGFFPDPEVGLVIGGWTVGVEMIFYVLFPVLLIVIKTDKAALTLMVLATLISYVSRAELHTQYLNTFPHSNWDWSYFTFLPNLYFFTVGIYAFRLKQIVVKNGNLVHIFIPISTLLTLSFLIFTQLDDAFKNPGRLDLIIWAFSFGMLCIWQSIKPSLWSANKIFEYLGERSYSIYLLHPLVIVFSMEKIVNLYSILEPSVGEYAFFLCSLIIIIIVLILSEITYRSIEVPGIKLGRKVIGRMGGLNIKRGIVDQ